MMRNLLLSKKIGVLLIVLTCLLGISNQSIAQQTDVTISTSATTNALFWSGGTTGPYTYTPSGAVSTAIIKNTDIQNRLLGASGYTANSVTIVTANASGTGNGNVTFNTTVTAATTSTAQQTFTVTANGSITVSNAINLTAGNASGLAGNNTARPGTNITFTAGLNISISAALTTTGNVRGNAAGGDAGDVSLSSTSGNISVSAITATGRTATSGVGGAGGIVTLDSSTGKILISGIINTTGGNGTVNNNGGRAGSINLKGPAGITLTSNLTANGGTTTGSGTAGSKGDFTINDGATSVTTGNDGQTGGVISGGNLSKTGIGTFVLSRPNTYTGLTAINAGTLKLGNATALGTTAGNTVVATGAVLDLNGQSIGSEELEIQGTGISSAGALINTNSTAASLSGNMNATLADLGVYSVGGSGNITLTGNVRGMMTKVAANTLTLGGIVDNVGLGVTANSGTVILAKTSNSSVHAIGGGGLTIGGGTVRLGGSGGDQIYDGCTITFNTGTFNSGVTVGLTETMSTMALTDNSTIALGTGVHTLTFANSSGVTWTSGKVLTITGWTGTAGSSGTAGRIYVGVGGLDDTQLANVSFTGKTSGAQILPVTGELVPILSGPILAISGTTNHDPACVGTAAAPIQYTITNTGAAASGVTVTSDDLQFVVSNLSSTTIANGGTATYDVTFTPNASGSQSAKITVAATGSNSPTSLLTGTGNPLPTTTITPSPADAASDVCYSGTGAVNSVSWAAVSGATSYDVYFGAGSLPGSVTSNVLTNSFTTGTLSANTTYYWKVVPKNACGDATGASIWTFTTASSTCLGYCAFSVLDGVDPITLVNIGDINNTSSNTSIIHNEDFTSITGNLTPGQNYNITVKGNTHGFTDYYTVYFDWNQNGDFTDANERFQIGTIDDSTGLDAKSASTTIAVPSNALPGNTRMRVICWYLNYSTSPCANTTPNQDSWGQAEDYTLNIIPACLDGTLNLNSIAGTDAQTVCTNTPIASITYAIGGGATGATVTGLPTGVTSSFNAGIVTISGSPEISSSYTITTTGTPSPCTEATITGSITVNSLPTVTWSGTLAIQCINSSSYTLKGGLPAGGTYSGSGVTGTNFDATTAGIGTKTLTYTYTDANSCTNKATNSITVNSLPTVTWSGALTNQCISSSSYTLTGGLPAGGTYSGSGVTGTNFDATTAGVGTKTLTYTYTDANGCINTAINTITVNALPDNTSDGFIGNTICAGSVGTLTFNAIDATFVEPYTIRYSDGTTTWNQSIASASSTTFDVAVNPNTNTIYSLVSITNGNGCVRSSGFGNTTAQITVNPIITPTVSIAASATTICSGTSVTFTATSTNGGAAPTYQWQLNGTPVGTNSATYTNSALANGAIVTCVMTSNAAPCLTDNPATSNTITMTVSPLSVGGSVSGGTTVCSGSTSGLLTLSGYAGTVTKWQSSTDGTNWTDIANDLITYTSGVLTQTTQFRAVVISGTCSLANSSPTTVTVPVITINDGVPSSICQWSLVPVSASASGGTAPYTYSWEDSAGGPYFPGNVTTYSGSSPFISTSGINTGTYTNNLKLTVVDALGCTEVKLISVTVIPSVNSSWIAHPTAVCAGENGTIYTAEYLDNTTYTWTVSGGTIASGDGTNSITVNWGTGATGTVDVQAVTNLGCTLNLSQTVTIRPILGITLGTNPIICLGTTIASLPYSAKIGNPNRYNIDFDAIANTFGLVDVTNTILGSAPGNISIALPVNLPVGTYNGSLTLSDFTVTPVCTNTYPITIKVNPDLPASVSIVATATTICSGTSVTFTATPTNGGTLPTYQWKLNGSNVGSGGTTYINSSLANNDVISCVMTSNATPCLTGSPATSNQITMIVNPTPSVSTVSSFTICSDESPNISLTATPVSSFSWTIGTITGGIEGASEGSGAIINQVLTNPIYTDEGTVQYIVTPTAGSCVGSPYTITVTVNPLPFPGKFE